MTAVRRGGAHHSGGSRPSGGLRSDERALPHDAAEDAAAERMVRRTFERLTGRSGEPLFYSTMDDTPVGTLGLALCGTGLRRLCFVRGEDEFVRGLLAEFPERPLLSSPRLDPVRSALGRYFEGRDLGLDVPVDLSDLTAFQRRVLEWTARVPPGSVTTYARVAARAGRPGAARAAGNALHANPVAIVVPCHRVLRGDGSLGGYAGGLPAKEWLLRHEGALPGPA